MGGIDEVLTINRSSPPYHSQKTVIFGTYAHRVISFVTP
jgi:hypothetical protein